MKTETTFSRPVRIVVIGAGNRAHKYLEYARRNPEQLRLAAIVEVNDLRRRAMADAFGLPDKYCYAHYDDFFAERLDADMVLISTPENAHFDPAVKAIDAGYHVLLEKPIAQRLDECREIARRARRRGVLVGVCHVLRYHPYFAKIRELVASAGWATSFRSIIPLRSDSTGPPTATCAASSGARAKPIRSCWPSAVTTSTSCCG